MINLALSTKEKRGLSEDLQELAMIRKLQLITAPYLKRNSKFFLEGANVPEKSKAYHAPISQERFEKDLKDGKVTAAVCANLCKLSKEILEENGLNVDVISCDTDIFRHVDLLLTAKSGKQYIVNILEDLDLIQSFMRTPNFASKAYYDLRYKKFEENGNITTNGVKLENVCFIDGETDLLNIDKNLGYLEENKGLYLEDIYKELKYKLSDFRKLLLQGEYLRIDSKIDEEMANAPEEKRNQRKTEIMRIMQKTIENMSDEEILNRKLEWIFTYCNDRMNIKGHTDFVMYYSKSLLNNILQPQEYAMLDRYDGFTYEEKVPQNSTIKEALDYEKPDYDGKLRFSIVNCGDENHIISTKPNSFVTITNKELEEVKKYAYIHKAVPPSQLAINLSFKGHALPLIFHPIGGMMVNKKQESLNLEQFDTVEKQQLIEQTARNIITTDEPITSILIPYEKGEQYIYLDDENNFIVRENNVETIYYYDTKTAEYTTEVKQLGEER